MKFEKIKSFFKTRAAKSIIVASSALLIGLAIYLNYQWFYDPAGSLGYGDNNMDDGVSDNSSASGDASGEQDYFTSTALDRQEARDEALDVLKMVSESEESSEEAKAEAQQKISKIAVDIQNEANIETLVKAKGFEDCVAIISEGASFSRFALEEYLHKLENRKEPERPVRICSACGQTVAADFLFCPECGGRTVEQAAPQTVPEVPQSPHLFRERTGQWLQVAQPECTIGKSVSRNTCPITDNPTVSRLHAAITLRGDRFYAVDRGSTNGTWINGNRLEPHLEVPLAIGDSIKIADEMFYFQMK